VLYDVLLAFLPIKTQKKLKRGFERFGNSI